MGSALQKMAKNLQQANIEKESQDWIKTGQNSLNEKMKGDQDLVELASNIITFLAKYMLAKVGAIYLMESDQKNLKLSASYAFRTRKNMNNKILVGEGLIGQAAFEKEMIILSNVPDDYISINSGLGETPPKNIAVIPLIYETRVLGVVELGILDEWNPLQIELLKIIQELVGVSLYSAKARVDMKVMLEKTREQAEALQIQQVELKQTNEEMQVQQEELRVANEELEEQTKALKKSEQNLQQQQEELRVTNEELEGKTVSLEKQKQRITEKNIELEIARSDIELKAKELEISSKYKSEFLANMSHELRTPLNSLLILSQNLTNNKHKNLKDDQIEAAEIINKSGQDLLNLINEILDLSKIESGKMAFEVEEFPIEDIATEINLYFQHVIDEKGLNLEVSLSNHLPKTITSDRQRLEQIIKNLMSNAIKFTNKGEIKVEISKPKEGINLSKSKLQAEKALSISISDTGIGIPKEKHLSIFEAFQQAEGGTARKFGGTGLGLSISREIAKILGGEIQLESEEGKGSTFSLIIPYVSVIDEDEVNKPEKRLVKGKKIETLKKLRNNFKSTQVMDNTSEEISTFVDDDRNDLTNNDRTILIIEDDLEFAKVLLMQCHEKNFKCIVSPSGEDGLSLCEKHLPEAVILDIKLPGIDGLSVLDLIKENAATRHIPVHMMSAYEETIDAYKRGAIGYLMKPAKPVELEAAIEKIETFIDRKMKDLLIVEDDENLRKIIRGIIGDHDVNTIGVGTGSEAIDYIKKEKVDCIVLDLGLPDMSGFEMLGKLEKEKNLTIPPVIIYTGKDLTRNENEQLQKYTNSIIIKGVKSEERLLDETALFLHRVVSELPQHQQKVISNLHNKEALFENKNILIVDDDIRNIFALTQILEERGMNIHKAENGVKALELLDIQTNIDLILMDIMMPIMDGYETTKKIRKQNRYKKLPIIALTAKAMKGDKEKCLDAGTNDYLSKPVNIDKLLSLMRVWMYK
ncbi:MAG: response regulator [Bacteroidetes bacterium]|jgi:CheY-like chemotaxis protein|nr:response regulator [Bacteroidota bacterium]MBT6687281.1 response regulator [Bacteroidota bacterium]MBT7144498.1 response regulator [Bacteroidota bacterium]MBT7493065.1 response regulator [Bacteroidota bacterium]